MSHFFYAYAGNKRNEFKLFYDELYLNTEIKNIVEPFCGSSAMSFNLWLDYGDAFDYYLNDIDPLLISIYSLFMNESIEEIVKKVNKIKDTITNKEDFTTFYKKKEKTIYEYIISQKYYNMRPGLYNSKMHNKPYSLTKKQLLFIEFIKNDKVHITNHDWEKVFNNHNNEKSLILFDPPYLDSCNEFYSDKRTVNVYEHFYTNKIVDQPSKICFILEKIWIIDLLLGVPTASYDKVYQLTKKKTTHGLYKNY